MKISSQVGSLIQPHRHSQGQLAPGSQADQKEKSRGIPPLNKSTEDAAVEEKKSEKPLEDPSSSESKELRSLQVRDREVRAHEQAHLGAAGQYARGGANFTYQRGPDGKSYAVGGEVQIDVSPVANNPQATLAKADVIRRAALAPTTPSGQDRSVASQAGKMAIVARAELQKARTEKQSEATDTGTDSLKEKLQQSGALNNESSENPVEKLDTFI